MEAEALAGRHERRGPREEEEENEDEEGLFPFDPVILYRPRSDSVHSRYAEGQETTSVNREEVTNQVEDGESGKCFCFIFYAHF